MADRRMRVHRRSSIRRLDKLSDIAKIAVNSNGRWRIPVRKDLFVALTLATLLSGHATAIADELTGTLAKVKELGYITIGHREASVPMVIYPSSFTFARSEEHTSELQSHLNLVCRLLLEKKKYNQ